MEGSLTQLLCHKKCKLQKIPAVIVSFPVANFSPGSKSRAFFSRMASKRSVDIVNEEEDKEEENCAHQEVALREMHQDVVSLVGLQHPIMYDTNNICELASSSKPTATFSVCFA